MALRALLCLFARARFAHQVPRHRGRRAGARGDHARRRRRPCGAWPLRATGAEAPSAGCTAVPLAAARSAWLAALRSPRKRPRPGGAVWTPSPRRGRSSRSPGSLGAFACAAREGRAKRTRHGCRAAGCTAGLSPERATAIACMHTRTAPSDSLSADSSVASHPRDPALVARVRMARRACDDLEQQRGEALRSLSPPRCSRLLSVGHAVELWGRAP